MKYLFVSVYRSSGQDCTNNGLSANVDNTNLFYDCTTDEAINYCTDHNINPKKCFIVVERYMWGDYHIYAEPLIKDPSKIQVFGGNFLYTSDSRFHDIKGNKCGRPIPIHDRFETQEEYDFLTT